jgi:hypothetical protein
VLGQRRWRMSARRRSGTLAAVSSVRSILHRSEASASSMLRLQIGERGFAAWIADNLQQSDGNRYFEAKGLRYLPTVNHPERTLVV